MSLLKKKKRETEKCFLMLLVVEYGCNDTLLIPNKFKLTQSHFIYLSIFTEKGGVHDVQIQAAVLNKYKLGAKNMRLALFPSYLNRNKQFYCTILTVKKNAVSLLKRPHMSHL